MDVRDVCTSVLNYFCCAARPASGASLKPELPPNWLGFPSPNGEVQMSKDTNKREREKIERHLENIGLRPIDDRPLCIICQNPMPRHQGPVCDACD
ncbi:hypothetical protein Nham_1186 [Nitrobacter hamburgensis X14]|uniref:Uncharacterized protein n=1 Tax=Nitrobacter hamburgensis (strain DSM 10229 / NCIMB 13809 / X14) TaxID=323097 RepID=Q1QP25_NITHX|nr:hypothetical protein Nham_1186 [Nitrobacter hamburgensis X14]